MSHFPNKRPRLSLIVKIPIAGEQLQRHVHALFGTPAESPSCVNNGGKWRFPSNIDFRTDYDTEVNWGTGFDAELNSEPDIAAGGVHALNTILGGSPDNKVTKEVSNSSESDKEPIGTTSLKPRRGVYRSYRIGVESAPLTMVDLPKIPIGAVELLTFFPNHTLWPEVMIRLVRNGWANRDIARAALFARGTHTRDNIDTRAAALRQQVLRCGRDKFDDKSFKPSTHRHLLQAATGCEQYDASDYRPLKTEKRRSRMVARLIDLADGVVNWPGPSDSGPLTRAVKWAGKHDPDGNFYTTDIAWLAVTYGFRYPFEFSTELWDQGGRNRVFAAVEGR